MKLGGCSKQASEHRTTTDDHHSAACHGTVSCFRGLRHTLLLYIENIAVAGRLAAGRWWVRLLLDPLLLFGRFSGGRENEFAAEE